MVTCVMLAPGFVVGISVWSDHSRWVLQADDMGGSHVN